MAKTEKPKTETPHHIKRLLTRFDVMTPIVYLLQDVSPVVQPVQCMVAYSVKIDIKTPENPPALVAPGCMPGARVGTRVHTSLCSATVCSL